jgi:hypothetical protein
MSSKPKASAFSRNERLILTSWFEGVNCDEECDRPDVEKALDDRGYTEPVGFLYTRHQAAVAGIVLDAYQGQLMFEPDARAAVAEAIRRRSRKVPPGSEPTIRHLFSIRWGGAPGNSWANRYSLLWLPEFQRFVVTDSSDDVEPYEHADFAIGHFEPCADENAAAVQIIARHWRLRRDEWMDDEPVVLELQLGTIVAGVAERLLADVWKPEDEDEEDESAETELDDGPSDDR